MLPQSTGRPFRAHLNALYGHPLAQGRCATCYITNFTALHWLPSDVGISRAHLDLLTTSLEFRDIAHQAQATLHRGQIVCNAPQISTGESGFNALEQLPTALWPPAAHRCTGRWA